MLPGQGSEARIQANLARQMERLSRTPQGAQFLAEQQQEMDMLAQRSKLASTAIPVKDAAGNILGYTTGTGASLPALNNRRRSMTAEEAEQYGLVAVGSDEYGNVKYGQPKPAAKQQFIDSFTGNTVQFDADIDTSSLDPKRYTPLRRTTTAPAAPAAGSAAPAPAAPSATKSFMDRFKK
jgi:hypothetical protein